MMKKSEIDKLLMEDFYKEISKRNAADMRVLGLYVSQDIPCYYSDNKVVVENNKDKKEYMQVFSSKDGDCLTKVPIKRVLEAAIYANADGIIIDNGEVVINQHGIKHILREAERCEEIREIVEEKKRMEEEGIVFRITEWELDEIPKSKAYTQMLIDEINISMENPEKVAWHLLSEHGLSFYSLVALERKISDPAIIIKNKAEVLQEIQRQKSEYI